MSLQDLHRQTESKVTLRYDVRLDEDFDSHSSHPEAPLNACKDEEVYATPVPSDMATADSDSEDDIPLLPLATPSIPTLTSEANESTHRVVEMPELVIDHASVEIEEKGPSSNEDQDRTSATTLPSSTSPPSMTPSIPSCSPPSYISTTDPSLHVAESPEESPSDEAVCNTCEAYFESAQADVIRPHAPFQPTVRSSFDTPPRFVRVPLMNQYVESEADNAILDRGVELPSDKQFRRPATEPQLQGREPSVPADIYPPPSAELPCNSMDSRPQVYALVDSNAEPGDGTGPTVLVVEGETLAATTIPTPAWPIVIPTSLGNNPYLPWSMSSMGSGSYSSSSSPSCGTSCPGATSSNAGRPPPTPITSSLPRHARPLGEESPGTCLHCCLASSLCLDSLFRCFMKNCCCCCSGSTSHRHSTDDNGSFCG